MKQAGTAGWREDCACTRSDDTRHFQGHLSRSWQALHTIDEACRALTDPGVRDQRQRIHPLNKTTTVPCPSWCSCALVPISEFEQHAIDGPSIALSGMTSMKLIRTLQERNLQETFQKQSAKYCQLARRQSCGDGIVSDEHALGSRRCVAQDLWDSVRGARKMGLEAHRSS